MVNTIGTLELLKFCEKNRAKFLFASTSEVYGDPLEHPQKETYWGNVNPNGIRACYDESKRFAEAITSFEAALKADPDHLEAHNNLGNALVKVGRLDQAATQYRLALQLRPESAQTHRNLAALLLTQKKPDQAVVEYRLALAQSAQDAATHDADLRPVSGLSGARGPAHGPADAHGPVHARGSGTL